MERINRPNDDIREMLSRSHIEQICVRHGLPQPQEIIPEGRGNEKVIYYLDHRFALAFCIRKVDIETLALLERIEAIPTPRLIAWMEADPDLGSYMITERCPGIRLDALWDKTAHQQRLQVLEALGASMGRYHTVSASEVKKVADELSLIHRVRDLSAQPWQEAEHLARLVADGLGQLSAYLSLLGLEASTVIQQLEAHCAQRLSQPWRCFIGPGLVHAEAWEEHFIIEETKRGYQLSGCVDFDEVLIADSLFEMVFLYVSMLGLDSEYYQAFKQGYENFFIFPQDMGEALRLAAIDFDAWALVALSSRMQKPPSLIPDWERVWVKKRLHRLCGWLEGVQKIDRAMFRREIGPW